MVTVVKLKVSNFALKVVPRTGACFCYLNKNQFIRLVSDDQFYLFECCVKIIYVIIIIYYLTVGAKELKTFEYKY